MQQKEQTDPHYIERLTVKKLWGYKNFDIRFQKDVNVIIGLNASGKTTLINILYDTLSGNIGKLARTDFEDVVVQLRSFKGNRTRTVSVKQTGEELTLKVGNKSFSVPTEMAQHMAGRSNGDLPPGMLRRRFGIDLGELNDELSGLVPAVWLPVSRRLPIAEEEEVARRPLHRKPLESVDECLASLLEELQRYRLSLNAELSEIRKEFQRHALENILYDKQHDRKLFDELVTLQPPTEDDKLRLIQAFEDVGMIDARMKSRIEEHFAAARDAIEKQRSHPGKFYMEELLILPLLSRTRTIVEIAQKLEANRTQLFLATREYEEMVNSFLNDKKIKVSDKGSLIITHERKQRGDLEWRHLSSGEKQILILLTQALLSDKESLVYVADEPELSLHVMWQEKLLEALTRIAGQCQFIVATHSPDITAGFDDKVIDLARL